MSLTKLDFYKIHRLFDYVCMYDFVYTVRTSF